MADTLDLEHIFSPENIATQIGFKWQEWKQARQVWEEEYEELRKYLFATSTKTTTNQKLLFKNSTTIPKLAQIEQNLMANYLRVLFPNDRWFSWEAFDEDAATETKRRAIEAYVAVKLKQSGFQKEVKKLLGDWIRTGNCFGMLQYVNEVEVDEETGETLGGYVGPRLFRISPHDIVFNPTATDFQHSPKIIRSLKSLGELHRDIKERPELGYTQEILDELLYVRKETLGAVSSTSDQSKTQAYIADGFGTIEEYYNSGMVEILEFRGDYFDGEEFLPDCIITVVDRRKVVRKEKMKSWTGSGYIYHSAWRHRPENLYGMSPLVNLTGMQYKVDKLENVRADVFDMIAMPQKLIIGDVQPIGAPGAPGTRWIASEGASVSDLRPDATALQADLQIDYTLRLMEELAGAPKEAMGIRTPGEKTAFEVDKLTNASFELFKSKVREFEDEFLVLVLNDVLEMGRRFLNSADTIKIIDNTVGFEDFLTVSRDDLIAAGQFFAAGSRNFEKKSRLLQNLQLLYNSPLGQVIDPHVSKVKLAKLVEQAMDLDDFDIFTENVGLDEQANMQRHMNASQDILDEEQAAADVSRIPTEEL